MDKSLHVLRLRKKTINKKYIRTDQVEKSVESSFKKNNALNMLKKKKNKIIIDLNDEESNECHESKESNESKECDESKESNESKECDESKESDESNECDQSNDDSIESLEGDVDTDGLISRLNQLALKGTKIFPKSLPIGFSLLNI